MFNLSSAIVLNLVTSKILSFGKELRHELKIYTHYFNGLPLELVAMFSMRNRWILLSRLKLRRLFFVLCMTTLAGTLGLFAYLQFYLKCSEAKSVRQIETLVSFALFARLCHWTVCLFLDFVIFLSLFAISCFVFFPASLCVCLCVCLSVSVSLSLSLSLSLGSCVAQR